MSKIEVVGSARSWTGGPEQYGKHVDEILHWCEGGEVQVKVRGQWLSASDARFHVSCEYRKAPCPAPRTGEVWRFNALAGEACLVLSGGGALYLSDSSVSKTTEAQGLGGHKLANSLEEYYKRV